jgi:hypothetical protein
MKRINRNHRTTNTAMELRRWNFGRNLPDHADFLECQKPAGSISRFALPRTNQPTDANGLLGVLKLATRSEMRKRASALFRENFAKSFELLVTAG